jgi:hypothetical protein
MTDYNDLEEDVDSDILADDQTEQVVEVIRID